MSDAPKFIMIGGFLGAGKTTTLGRLAALYRSQGQNVAIVTNDQASDLVDTLLLRSQGFQVGEVAGSCFCCNFDGLTGTVEKLSAKERPDVILAEPVGSCTDLVATVIRPLEQVYEQAFDIAPYGVIIKPSHGIKILGGEGQRGFSPKAEYIFRKQLEEADFLILNRIDELAADQVEQLVQLLESQYPSKPIVKLSAKSGAGFELLYEQVNQSGSFGNSVMEVDYEIYAEGEAELGWLNCQATLTSESDVNLDELILEILKGLHVGFVDQEFEIAHLKAIGMSDGVYAVANIVSNNSEPVLSLPSRWSGRSGELVINARVATSPEELETWVRQVVAQKGTDFGATITIRTLQCFRPGKPVPTHRIPS
ncbi:GTP-binding protein [Pirellulaceae bacterium SH449]